jgi:hypothetical protein
MAGVILWTLHGKQPFRISSCGRIFQTTQHVCGQCLGRQFLPSTGSRSRYSLFPSLRYPCFLSLRVVRSNYLLRNE